MTDHANRPPAGDPPSPTCRGCGGEMIQKSRSRLLSAGIGAVALGGVLVPLSRHIPFFWPPTIGALLTGGYLLVWATFGHARWCRECKKFDWGA